MDLFNRVLFAVSFCSLIHSYAQAGVCQDNNPAKCSQYAEHCRYQHTKEQCPLTCKQCAPSSFSPSPTWSPTSSLSSSVSMTSSSNLSPTQSAVVVLKSSVGGNKVNRNTTATASASERDLQHAKMLMSIGFLCGYFFSSR